MANTKKQHVVPYENNEWAVKAEDSEQPSKTFKLKMSAVAYAFDIADNNEGTVVVHKTDGTFQDVHVTEDTSKLLAVLTA